MGSFLRNQTHHWKFRPKSEALALRTSTKVCCCTRPCEATFTNKLQRHKCIHDDWHTGEPLDEHFYLPSRDDESRAMQGCGAHIEFTYHGGNGKKTH